MPTFVATVADAITAAIEIPFVHIADTTGHAVRAEGLSTVGLLATAYTMEQDFYAGRLRDQYGQTVFIPDPPDRRLVHDVIYDELCQGIGQRPLTSRAPAHHG